MSFITSKSAKLFAGVVGFAIALAIVGGVSFSKASAYSSNLTIGSSGADVTTLQNWLISKGFSLSAGATGYFGSQTQAALAAFQSANGISPAVGYFGPVTMAKVNAMGSTGAMTYPAGCMSATGFSTTTGMSCAGSVMTYPAGCMSATGFSTTTGMSCAGSVMTYPAGCMSTAGFSSTTGMSCSGGSTPSTSGPLTGGAGSVESYDLISGLNDEEVGEDTEDVEVAGLEVEVDDGSDLEFTAVKLDFADAAESADAAVTADEDFEDYASEVSVWLDGKEVARVDADAFTDDNNWDKTVSLDGAVCKAGETCELTVAVSGIANLDTNDDGEPWGIDFTQVRWEDASGTVISEDPAVAETPFSFELFATAADTELQITAGADDEEVNEGHVVNIHATDETENVAILSFNLEVEGDSDVELDALPVSITVGTQDNVDEMVSELTLWMDGEEVGSASIGSDCGTDADCVTVGTTEDYNFEDLGLTLEAGDDHEFLVKASIYGITDTGDVAAGDTILAVFGETQTDDADFDAEDQTGEELADGDTTGTVTGEASEVRDIGFNLAFVSSDADVETGELSVLSDVGTFEILFNVTPFDGDVFIDLTAPDLSGGATESDLAQGGTAAGTLTCNINGLSGYSTGTDGYEVEEGDTGKFKVVCDVRDGGTDLVDGFTDISIGSILYALSDVDGDLVYNFNLTEFKTPSVYLDDQGF